MKTQRWIFGMLLAAGAVAAHAQNGAVQGYCQAGGAKVVTQGATSTTTVQASYPGCTVTVYVTGTGSLATLSSSVSGAALPNPFVAATDASWRFWAPTATCYDVIMTGGTPRALPSPQTLTAVCASGGGGTTYLSPGTGITITGAGTPGSPYVISAVTSTPLTITSFNCGVCGTVEIGTAIVNPVLSATYSTTPASASITNTDGINSPLTLLTPFTSGTVTGTFTHATSATTTFTLSATQGTTQTATQTMTWQPRSFGGAGAGGASATVTAVGTTAALSTEDILPSIDLAASNVGSTYGPFVASSQNVYLLLIGGSHTFVDTGTGFPFAFQAPVAVTFVNSHGVSVTMYLYQSTNPLFGTYSIKVVT